MWSRLFTGTADWHLLVAALVPTLVLAWLAAHACGALTAAMRQVLRDTVSMTSPLVRAPLRMVGLATFALVFSLLIFPAFEIAGLHPRIGLRLDTLSRWAFDSGLNVVLIVAVAFAVVRTVAVAVSGSSTKSISAPGSTRWSAASARVRSAACCRTSRPSS